MSLKNNNNNNNNDYNHVINNLQDYTLDETNIKRALEMKIDTFKNVDKNEYKNEYKNVDKNEYKNVDKNEYKNVDKNDVKNKESNAKGKLFIPKEKDTLFWIFYIMKNSDVKYEMLDNKNILVEKKMKIDYIEKIRKEKQIVKTYKFATLTHIENNLANENYLDIKTF